MNKIAIIIPYFGKWPEWIDLFIYSCTQNQAIDFFVFTDCNKLDCYANNIKIQYLSFSDYCKRISDILKIDFNPINPYKLCDLKPFYGIIHSANLKGYDFWGFGDIDIVWGNISEFYTNDLLSKYDVFSTHNDRMSGHLGILRNNEKYRNLCFKIKNWDKKLVSKENYTLDETDFSTLIFPESKYIRHIYKKICMPLFGWRLAWTIYYSIFPLIHYILRIEKRKLYFKEQHTTPILSSDGRLYKYESDYWYYQNGKIFNNRNKIQYIYLHFMVYKRNNARKDYYWHENFYKIVKEEIGSGVVINKKGFFKVGSI